PKGLLRNVAPTSTPRRHLGYLPAWSRLEPCSVIDELAQVMEDDAPVFRSAHGSFLLIARQGAWFQEPAHCTRTRLHNGPGAATRGSGSAAKNQLRAAGRWGTSAFGLGSARPPGSRSD